MSWAMKAFQSTPPREGRLRNFYLKDNTVLLNANPRTIRKIVNEGIIQFSQS